MREKGAVALLDAAPGVWRHMPDTRFIFIGPASPEEAAIFDNADPRIYYLGKVSAQEKADALAACDLFCMPSMSEILPTVYLEAWSFSKPVVGGMAHGLPELVEGNGAGVVARQDADELAEKLVRLLGDQGSRERYGRAGKELVEQKYSVVAVADALLEVYGRLSKDKCKDQPAGNGNFRALPPPPELV